MVKSVLPYDNRPIGVFDSGLGGLTVARELATKFPNESIYYVGDTFRCPYGSREVGEVRSFVLQVASWLIDHDVKALVIACNTATASGLRAAQKAFDIPIIGVVEPGAVAAIEATKTGRIGVLATELTIKSGAYTVAIHHHDPSLQVFGCAAQPFVALVEDALAHDMHTAQDWYTSDELFMDEQTRSIVDATIAPLLEKDIDTVVTGCTHFPLLKAPIKAAFGDSVHIVSSSEKTCQMLFEKLQERGQLAADDAVAHHRFATTSPDTISFRRAGEYIFGSKFERLEHVDVLELEGLI